MKVNDPPVMGILLRMLLAEFDNFALDTLIPNEEVPDLRDPAAWTSDMYVLPQMRYTVQDLYLPVMHLISHGAHDMWAC